MNILIITIPDSRIKPLTYKLKKEVSHILEKKTLIIINI